MPTRGPNAFPEKEKIPRKGETPVLKHPTAISDEGKSSSSKNKTLRSQPSSFPFVLQEGREDATHRGGKGNH